MSESAAVFSTAGLDRQNGTDYYAVDFTANGRTYAYDIDAVTGVIIDSSEDQSQPAQATDGGRLGGRRKFLRDLLPVH